MSVNDVFIFGGVSGTDANNFNLRGGVYVVTLVAESWGTVTLNVLAADETTWVPFHTWSANVGATMTLVAGLYQFAYSSLGTATLSIAQQPPSPTWRPEALSQPLPFNSSGGVTTISPLNSDTDLTLNGDTITLAGDTSIVLDSPAINFSNSTPIITMGDASGSGAYITTGFTGNNSGAFGAQTNDVVGSSGTSGGAYLGTGAAGSASGNSGTISLYTGDALGGTGGDILLSCGSGSDASHSGHILLQTGKDVTANLIGGANFIILNLPTSSAGLPSGALWNNSGTLKIV